MSHALVRVSTLVVTAMLVSDCSNGPIDFSSRIVDATGGATSPSTTGGKSPFGGTPAVATGGTTAVATGGAAEVATGGVAEVATGGAAEVATGGASNDHWLEVSPGGGAYTCPGTDPSGSCECDEPPCYCTYIYHSIVVGADCPPGTVFPTLSAYAYACIGGIWRGIAGHSQAGGWCQDASLVFATGGATSTGGASSTGGATSGGASSSTATTVSASGGSYSGCPVSEPYAKNTHCECTEPPCQCTYQYQWPELVYCPNDTMWCQMGAEYTYVCQDGLWASSSGNYSIDLTPGGCYCSTSN